MLSTLSSPARRTVLATITPALDVMAHRVISRMWAVSSRPRAGAFDPPREYSYEKRSVTLSSINRSAFPAMVGAATCSATLVARSTGYAVEYAGNGTHLQYALGD